MAEDVVALLDYIGWTAERDLHIVGISLGGMIALGRAIILFPFFRAQLIQLHLQSWRIRYRIASSH